MRDVRLLIPFLACAGLLGAAGCDDTTRVRSQTDSGITCGANERLFFGECKFVCDRDSDCGTDEQCNLFTGACEPKAAQPDAGVVTFPCTFGAVRCRADNKAVEACTETGTWQGVEMCQGDGFCLNETCLACQPGVTRCKPDDVSQIQICPDDGSGFMDVTCSNGGTCVQGECRECAPNTTRCSPDGKNVQTCTKTSDPALSWAWRNSGDNFDGTCITQQCVPSNPAMCKAPDCIPGQVRCGAASNVQETCSQLGQWEGMLCSAVPGLGPEAECQNGVCIDECAEAAKQKSYFGCEYWGAVTDNLVDKYFKGNTTSGQGTTDSDFAFVVTNQSVNPATVTVYRYVNGAEVQLKQVTVPGSGDPATKGLATIKVPWQSIGGASASESTTGRARYAYRLKSNRPVTVYQFSPLDAVKTGASCSNNNQCTAAPLGQCLTPASGGGKVCHYYTYSNDASLLLPAHILGTQYVAIAPDHIKGKLWDFFGTTPYVAFNAQLTIVATKDNTVVELKSKAKTLAGGGVNAVNAGSTTSFTLNRYEVLQLATDNNGTDIECSADPFSPLDELCRVPNDLTGSVITATEPVAVFTGSACTLVPYNQTACDHVEEQVFPFSTWGKEFVAVRSHPLRRTDGTFAPASAAGPDYYKIVASCPATNPMCAQGTTITFSTPPAASDVLLPNKCQPGTSVAANNCRLLGGDFIHFRSKNSFRVTANFPIAVAQIFAGQNATTGTPAPQQGDPSFILLPPVEQWRAQYTVLAAPGIKDNYIALAVDNTKVKEISVDGVVVPLTSFSSVPGAPGFGVKNHPVSVGTHTIKVVPNSGQTAIPGAGVTVYGFDSYVSYGYTGGLDLGSIVTGIDPGG